MAVSKSRINAMGKDGMNGLHAIMRDYVSGGLSHPAHILVQSHLELVPDNRSLIGDLEALAGCELEDCEPVDLCHSADMLADILKETVSLPLDDVPDLIETEDQETLFPRTLSRYIGVKSDEIEWRTKAPGIKVFKLEKQGGLSVSLLKINPGKAMPNHSHGGRELTLVLKGAFRDENGLYGRGDISVADETTNHSPAAEPGEECICFVVQDGALHFSNPLTRIISALLPN